MDQLIAYAQETGSQSTGPSAVWYIIAAVGLYKMFEKAGEPGWAGFIPFYNKYKLCEKVMNDPWYWVRLIVVCVPFVGWIAAIYFAYQISKATAQAYGKPESWAWGYLLLPPVIFFTASMFPALRSRGAGQGEEEDAAYLNLLPQVEEKDQLSFLDDYFSARQPEVLKKFIALNRDVSIIADYSSGSNASTMLCMDKQAIFFRKYAFDRDGEKLAEQLQWLRAHETKLPLCEIIGSNSTREYCCYDMRYYSEAVGMFQYVHSHPIEAARSILLSVLDTVEAGLYHGAVLAGEGVVEQYIARKVTANLELLSASRELHELLRS